MRLLPEEWTFDEKGGGTYALTVRWNADLWRRVEEVLGARVMERLVGRPFPLRKEQIARTTFMRLIKEYDLLDKAGGSTSKKRLAFAMRYANELWQAVTMFGPQVPDGGNC